MITNAFTCTGPYAILIMLGIKRVENRSMMPVPGKGRCAVSCSKKFCKEEYGNFVQWASRALPPEDFALVPAWNDVKEWPGKVVGCVDYAALDRAARGSAPTGNPVNPVNPVEISWDEGYQYWWNLSEVVCFDEPISCRGNTGMWQMPDALAKTVTAADELGRRADLRILTSEAAAKLFRAALPIVGSNEGFFVLPLDEDRRPKSMPVLVSLGTGSTASVQLKDVFAEVLKSGAEMFFVAHNHPHGTLVSSAEDIALTKAIRSAAELLGVKMLDHIILGINNEWVCVV